MKNNYIYYILLIFITLHISIFVNAQGWQHLQGGLDSPGSNLFSDSISGNIFIGGDFGHVNGHNCNGIAAWNGSSWDTTYGIYGQFPNQIISYQNNLYALGGS